LPEANPVLRPGDIVVVPEGAQAYVVGNVIKPSTIPLREPTTVSRAIAMAGGTGVSSQRNHVRVVRQIPGSQVKQEIYVDLSAVEKRKADDIILLPNDIVDVPTSGTKSFLRSLTGAVAPALSQVPVRVIP
jgi:polysaccharide export outer membrane protein